MMFSGQGTETTQVSIPNNVRTHTHTLTDSFSLCRYAGKLLRKLLE